MIKGISTQGFIPVRLEASHTSEMLTQILFGESYQILESRANWHLVRSDFDSTEGWASLDSIQGAEEETGSAHGFKIAVHPSVSIMDLDRGSPVILPAGSIWNAAPGEIWMAGGRHFKLQSEEGWIKPASANDPEETATLLLSLPGLHGGRCGFGLDATGLIQFLYRCMDISLPRDCKGQADVGSALSFIHEAKKGDLAFFDDSEGEISHVGMVLGKGKVLHAFDQVRIDTLDHQGIFNVETGSYTHRLRIIKRITKQA